MSMQQTEHEDYWAFKRRFEDALSLAEEVDAKLEDSI